MSNPYNILDHSIAYSFRNDEGVNYICSFSDVTNHYAPILGAYDIHLIDFSFFPERDTTGVDPRTGETICKLLESQFKDNCCVITFVCDENDGRQKMRQRKFQSWCDRFMPEYELQPINITLETEGGLHYRCAGVLTHPDFPHDQELHDHLISQVAGIVADKNVP